MCVCVFVDENIPVKINNKNILYIEKEKKEKQIDKMRHSCVHISIQRNVKIIRIFSNLEKNDYTLRIDSKIPEKYYKIVEMTYPLAVNNNNNNI